MKKTKNSKALLWIGAKRYYIVLLICVVALSLSFFVSSFKNQSKIASLNESIISTVPYEMPYESVYIEEEEYDAYEASSSESEVIYETDWSEEIEDVYTDDEAISAAEVSTEEITSLSYPVDGDIITEHSKNKLIYSKTLDDWRIHEGVDITAEASAPVYSAYDGIVDEITESDELGICITLKHSDSLKTKYCNLAKNDTVKVGDSVKAGDIIGEVGNTALYETGDVSHLHFEVIANGDSTNPLEFLKK